MQRRQFALIATGAPLALGASSLTAQAVISRIQSKLGGDWAKEGPDGLKAGDPSTPVKGVATTAMATLDVLKLAVKSNTNLILTYEPTFYARADVAAKDDPVANAKREFISKNGLVVFRLRDHWQLRKENEMVTGLAATLGWSAHRVAKDDGLYEIPASSAESVVGTLRKKLNLRAGLRAVGDRSAMVRKVLLYPGSMSTSVMWKRYSEVDMIVAGEVREWESTHYAADMFTAGEKRALVTIGRAVSEEPGMRECAEWVKRIVPEVPAKWIGIGDPYWRPA